MNDGGLASTTTLSLYALSPVITVTVIPPTAAPTNVMLIPADSEMIVSWNAVADADNDGSAITGYTATAIEGANTFTCGDKTSFNSCILTGLANSAQYSVTVVARNSEGNGPPSAPPEVATPRAAPANTPPVAQVVSAEFDLRPGAVSAGGSFRLLFVTTATTTAQSSDISLYNAFVQTSANDGHDDIGRFKSEFRALISTEAVDARDNTATNTFNGTDTKAPIYWLDGDKVADDYDDFYDDDGWDSQAGRDQNGVTLTGTSINIWTGSERDGTEASSFSQTLAVGADSGTRFGQLEAGAAGAEIIGGTNSITSITGKSPYPLYALSPILILNQAPTSTPIPDQTAFADAAFTYTFTAFTDADNDTITYSASESLDATWLNFDPATRTFSGMPAVANDGEVITITVTASDDMDSVTAMFTVTVINDTHRSGLHQRWRHRQR